MSMMTLAQAHAMLPGSRLLNVSAEAAKIIALSRVGTDSRQIDTGELFVALAGERFDAHDFLADVARSGAGAALVSNAEQCPTNLPGICVADTRIGLGNLAKAWRANYEIPLVLVTGSNGKTTVKEMIAAIFKAAVGEAHTLVTKGNLNNDIGLPLTLLKLRSTDRLAVVELGMNHPGETAQLAAIAQANIALINNAQREHQEFMATVAAVAEEHADVVRTLPKNGIAVFPADSEFTSVWREAAGARRVIDFALISTQINQTASVKGRLLSNGRVEVVAENGSVEIQLNTLGSHNVRNALAASAVAIAAGIGLEIIKEGLESFTPVNGRMQAKKIDPNHTLIDDSYNANPDSVRAAIDALKQSGNISWLILGDMGEVGNQGPEFHREVGAYAAEQGVAKLFALGEQCQFAIKGFEGVAKNTTASKAIHFSDMDSLIAQLRDALHAQSTGSNQHLNILVKGSRFMRMERVVQALLEEAKTCS
ncbi:UDP-N-acetylmuramoyl-tripeptide--D-alanyl-D-alanine ligase [Polynucleobacter wuianus]|uniref:UDP-N-acetylmuramoyl-tripeptide--D-alanyl-D-alanine ligase n=1 Tax=Polynucleobacter wuianus TaxID=1743168 RepID=A0A191UD16_9BURK|nr:MULTISPECIES: UDP-N-acetylmuramoyl-tripeptide--D-alanyl-D-alanine ligase [Polynucleobacter]ANI98776.1 UDP-N-acetylmuramoyl-tripeptide--D-alanyl-D-alanine ligase [Polynucleobacter wuianus]MBU3553346.1 UDP-N-acetylmuramoyl-tripeptide--D-alanyl-D-alanine ligase [Polynucleobacter sp. MWH-Post4-6-1]